jgi:chromosomal replication initiation ATPase DnaA
LDRFGGNVIEIANPDTQTRLKILAHYLIKADIELDEKTFLYLVNKTEGLSIRSIEDLVSDIHMAAHISNQGKVNQQIIEKALKDTKQKFVNNLTDSEIEEKTLQRRYTYTSYIHSILGSATCALALAGSMYAGISTIVKYIKPMIKTS